MRQQHRQEIFKLINELTIFYANARPIYYPEYSSSFGVLFVYVILFSLGLLFSSFFFFILIWPAKLFHTDCNLSQQICLLDIFSSAFAFS